MYKIIQPPHIIFGQNAASNYSYPSNCLVITSKGAKKRSWLDYLGIKDFQLFDKVESNPSMELVQKILSTFNMRNLSTIIGMGGGSSMDVAKYVAFQSQKFKIMIPTTFGSGSEVTRISVLTVNGKKQSFHDDKILPDVAIIDPFFIENTHKNIIKNSAIDACAQCTEAFDSRNSHDYTRFLCDEAFKILEDAILNENYSRLPLGSLISGLGFGNSSTTLGHALSYVYSNEGYSHGHALAFTTTLAHKFNNSKFYDRFKKIALKLDFTSITIQKNLSLAADIILQDRRHLDNNPKNVNKEDLISLLNEINNKDLEQL